MSEGRWTDDRMERVVGTLLRTGVLLAGVVVAIGGAVYLLRHGTELPDHRTFHGEPDELRTLPGILSTALDFRGRGIIQLGVLLLIATPIARVAFLGYAFFRQRDYLFVLVTVIVL